MKTSPERVVELPGDLDGSLGLVLDVGGGTGAEVRDGAPGGVLLGGADEEPDGAVSGFVVDVVLTPLAGDGVLRLALPMEEVLADGVVEVAGCGGVVLVGLLQGDERQVGSCQYTPVWSGRGLVTVDAPKAARISSRV